MRVASFWVVSLLSLALLYFLCLTLHAPKIEATLRQTSLESLEKAGLLQGEDIVLNFDGRDALLQGAVGSNEVRQTIVDQVGAVWGVRQIDSRLGIVELTTPTATAASRASFLELERDNERIVLRGLLASEAEKDNLLDVARNLFGEDRVRDELEVDPQSQALWQSRAAQLLRALQPGWISGKARLTARAIQVEGTVLGETGRAQTLAHLEPLRGNLSLETRLEVIAPPPHQEVQERINTFLLDKTVRFESGSTVITENGKRVLNEVARWLQQAPEANVEIAGHTDTQGNDALNQELSQKRAEAVIRYLGTRLVSIQRLRPVGYGGTQPIAENTTPEGRQQNRRIEFLLLEEK